MTGRPDAHHAHRSIRHRSSTGWSPGGCLALCAHDLEPPLGTAVALAAGGLRVQEDPQQDAAASPAAGPAPAPGPADRFVDPVARDHDDHREVVQPREGAWCQVCPLVPLDLAVGARVISLVRFVLVRAAAAVLVIPLSSLLATLDDSPDANLGLGLLLLLAPLLVMAVWAAVDGARSGRGGRQVLPLAAAWMVVDVLVAVANAVWISVAGALTGGGFFVEGLLSDLRLVAPNQAVMGAILVVLALVVAYILGRSSTTPGS